MRDAARLDSTGLRLGQGQTVMSGWAWTGGLIGRRTVPISLLIAGLAILAFVAYTARPVSGFAINSSLTNGTETDRSDDLLDAARWSDLPGSYVDDGVRGLGGGLEYAVSEEFCAKIIPQFVDNPTCEEIRDSIQQGFDTWSLEHPLLRFEDVSDSVQAALPPSGADAPWRGYGAEIDLFALTPKEYTNVKGYGAWTQFWYKYRDPLGTNGQILSGNSMTSADIVFNSQACYFLDPALDVEGCNNFGFLLVHETGHVFGLDHVGYEDTAFFDTDYDPSNSIEIDCESPHNGLKLSPNSNSKSVMNLGLWEGETEIELSADDVGALQFLYPVCSGDELISG